MPCNKAASTSMTALRSAAVENREQVDSHLEAWALDVVGASKEDA